MLASKPPQQSTMRGVGSEDPTPAKPWRNMKDGQALSEGSENSTDLTIAFNPLLEDKYGGDD